MYREIKKKILILENRKPFPPEIKAYMEEVSFHDWIYSSLRLDGSAITKQNVTKIMKGEFVVSVNLMEHSCIRNYIEAIKLISVLVDMKNELSEKVLLQIYQVLFPEHTEVYRTNNPVLIELQYNPPHFKEIEEQMELLFDWLSEEDATNPIRKATYLHNKIIEIYPFGAHSAIMARMALLYYLIQHGFPPISLDISESQYNDAMYHYLKTENPESFYQVVERGVYNQLEVMLQLTSSYR
ncbi:Fic family protein [Anaerovorax sp. IOR16]|uniref:Fic family protein n=1 Tax=Anaerovorax sp. IOR16 TaxID=2773458 RepID=UPI0019D22A73|nr:Fic family protein [Anaerovorax sp. IOR16]